MCAQTDAGLQGTAIAMLGYHVTNPAVATSQSGWYTVATNATITTSVDTVSGIAWTQYSWDVNNACTPAGTVYTGSPIPIPAGNGGLHTLYMCTQTNTGLAEEQTAP